MRRRLRVYGDDCGLWNSRFPVSDFATCGLCELMYANRAALSRDANGIRPLCLGSRPSETLEGATDYFLASESVALTQLGFGNIVDILPGQAVFIQKGGAVQFCQIVPQKAYAPDIFEFFYFARPDTYMDGISVYRSRQIMGRKLAEKMKRTLTEQAIREIDVSECSGTAGDISEWRNVY